MTDGGDWVARVAVVVVMVAVVVVVVVVIWNPSTMHHHFEHRTALKTTCADLPLGFVLLYCQHRRFPARVKV